MFLRRKLVYLFFFCIEEAYKLKKCKRKRRKRSTGEIKPGTPRLGYENSNSYSKPFFSFYLPFKLAQLVLNFHSEYKQVGVGTQPSYILMIF